MAIISVIVVHSNACFGGTFAGGRVSGPLAAVFGCGWIGVDLFFVLSGFLITGILTDAKGSGGYLRNFYARRSLRIMPLYFAYLLFIIVLSRVKPMRGMHPLSAGEIASLAAYYYNFRTALVTQGGLPELHHFWSLAVEEHFYLVWPMLVLLLPSRSLMRLCVAGAIASLLLRIAVISSGLWLQVAYLITPCRVDGLLAGSFVALAFRHEEMVTAVRRWARPVVLGSGCLLLGMLLGQRHFVDFADLRRVKGPAVDSSMTLTVGITALSLFFGGGLVLILDAAPGGIIRRTLERPWLVAIGKYSYGMYVWHAIVLTIIMLIVEHGMPGVLKLPDYVTKPCLSLVLLCGAFIAAYFSYHFYEKHFLGLKRFFVYKNPMGSRENGTEGVRGASAFRSP